MFGFVKVCAATPEIRVADCAYNAKQILNIISETEKGTSVLVLPELCVTGYTCGDLFNQKTLIDAAEREVGNICKQSAFSPLMIFLGAPCQIDGRLYNCAIAINRGRILGIVPKTYIPEYSEFYEARHFEPAPGDLKTAFYAGFEVPFGTDIIFKDSKNRNFTISCELCEDLWVPQSPSIVHTQAGANIIVNLSCSDETVGKQSYRRDLVKMQSAKLICGYVYADSGDGESTQDMVFAGNNIIAENGEVLADNGLFSSKPVYGEIDVEKLAFERQRMSSTYFCIEPKKHEIVEFEGEDCEKITRKFAKQPFVPAESSLLDERTKTILSIQKKGLVKRLKHTNCKTCVIGVSGGLDSALALLIVNAAFDELGLLKSGIICISMPGFGTTINTSNNSKELILSLGCTYKEISISSSVENHFKEIGHDSSVHDVAYENAQARYRTYILMDTANELGGIVIGTGDMSELALGWCTYNGDHMSMYAVNSSVPKTLVKHLICYESERLGGKTQKILQAILSTDISPELLPPDKDGKISQKTEDIIGPYILHDFFLYYAVRWGFTSQKTAYLAYNTFEGDFSKDLIDKWLKVFYTRFFSQQFKRSCIPDGVKVGSVALSPRGDWRMPTDAQCLEWIANL